MIGHWMVFDGNLLRQSIFVQLRQDRPPAIFLRSEFSANERRLAESRRCGTVALGATVDGVKTDVT